MGWPRNPGPAMSMQPDAELSPLSALQAVPPAHYLPPHPHRAGPSRPPELAAPAFPSLRLTRGLTWLIFITTSGGADMVITNPTV